ncbi:MAG: diguanylate cyclase [Acetatifactor sp.]
MRKRKRIALFANGWNSEYLQEFGHGAFRYAKEMDTDMFFFINYSTHGTEKEDNSGEFNIYLLPDLKDFDGAIFLTNTFNLDREIMYLQEQVQLAGIPVISTEYEMDGTYFCGADNYSGMYDLTTHLIKDHGIRDILFIGGYKVHVEVQARLRAVLDAARENGVEIPENNIVYGDWSAKSAQNCMAAWLNEGNALPEAVICANDIMAEGICDWLSEQGYKIPDDIKVTGFDCIRAGQEHDPVITSVNREWENMGYQAMRFLLDKVEGKATPPDIKISTRLVCGESCGCEYSDKKRERYAKLGRGDLEKAIDGLNSDQHLRHLYLCIRKVNTLEGMRQSYRNFFKGDESWMEGENFMLCIHPGFIRMDDEEDICKEPGYPEEMEVVCMLHNDKCEDCKRLPTKEAIFQAAERSDEPGLYLFVPVRSDDNNIGFAMMNRSLNILNDNILYVWTRHVNQYMDQVLSNVKIAKLTKKLEDLSVTDALTGVYNRMGCERILYPFLEECQKKGGRGIVMIADIDRMKTINDKYGHGEGDMALKTVASVLKAELPEGFLVSRFGGDEFFIAGESDGKTCLDEIIKRVSKQLASEVELRKLVFPLTISIGGVEMEKGEKFELYDCLQKADKFMYSVKERHHKEIDKIM